MRTELIEYHQHMLADANSKPTSTNEEVMRPKLRAASFHERAVAWLESLDEGLAISAAAERRIQRDILARLNKQVNG